MSEEEYERELFDIPTPPSQPSEAARQEAARTNAYNTRLAAFGQKYFPKLGDAPVPQLQSLLYEGRTPSGIEKYPVQSKASVNGVFGFDAEAYESKNPTIARPWQKQGMAGLAAEGEAAGGGSSNAGAFAQAGGGVFGSILNFGSNIFNTLENNALTRESWKATQLLQQKGYQNALGLQNNELKNSETLSQYSQASMGKALTSMGLPAGAWAVMGSRGMLPTATSMTPSGSFVKSMLPGDPGITSLTGSVIQQQAGWGDYTS